MTAEAADVLYHLLVMLEARGVTLDAVMAELEKRTAQSGLAEKASRPSGGRWMDQPLPTTVSPHRIFPREEWAKLRADTPLTLSEDDLARLKSLNDPISLDEVVEIYLPLSRLLSLYVAATQGLYDATRTFLGTRDGADALHHRRRRLGRGRQVDHGAHPARRSSAAGRTRPRSS